MLNFIAKDEDKDLRLDVFLANNLDMYSRAYLQKIIKESVLVNGVITRASYKLRFNDSVQIDIDPDKVIEIPKIEVPIIYEDKDCLVINKPIGLLSHSKGNYNNEATVESFISDKVSDFKSSRAGIVHRLDRATSGVMICSKNPEAHKWLQKQFSTRKVTKVYNALVTGHMSEEEAIIDMPILRNPKNPSTFKVSSNGKSAITKYKVLRTTDHYSLLQMEPRTGRTHQLRVHLRCLEHPVIGDTLYNGKQADRLYLHAKSLEITLPNNERKTFNVELPKEFLNFLQNDE
jgi:23S rRNA pseudouridine1911/1915/1917 synthase